MKHFVLLCLVVTMVNYAVACENLSDPTHQCRNPDRQYVDAGLSRFYDLDKIIDDALFENDLVAATALSDEYLELAEEYRINWNYENALYWGHIAKGIIALRQGELTQAAEFMVTAAQWHSLTPDYQYARDFRLAHALLQKGFAKPVLEYLRRIEPNWAPSGITLRKLIEEIEAGAKPRIDLITILNAKI